MQVDKKYKLDKIVSTDETRPHLCKLFFDREADGGACFVAADGQAAAKVRVKDGPGDKTGPVDPMALVVARKMIEGASDIVMELNETHATVLLDITGKETVDFSPRVNEPAYPQYAEVFPTEPPDVLLTINPKMLANLADALGSPKSVTLGIRLPQNGTVPTMFCVEDGVTVTPTDDDQARGVIMPMGSRLPADAAEEDA